MEMKELNNNEQENVQGGYNVYSGKIVATEVRSAEKAGFKLCEPDGITVKGSLYKGENILSD